MFLDIRNFSNFCEKKTPEEINKYQNEVLSFMIEIVTDHRGIVNQILGDGFMATFGAPVEDEKHTLNAVSAADEIMLIAAGGGGAFSACIAPWSAGRSTEPVTRAIATAIPK